jgi:peptide/nickel transport system ATP-binding protein
MSERLFFVNDLNVARPGAGRAALDRFSLTMDTGEAVVLLGEPGCGKETVLAMLVGYFERGEDVSGTVKFRDAAPERASRRTRPLRTAYLPSPNSHPLSPHASAISQFARIVARKLQMPPSTARAEFALVLERFAGAPSVAVFENRPGALAPEILAWGLMAAAFAQTPELLIADDPFARLQPTQSRALMQALVAEKKRQGFALLYAAMNTDATKWFGERVIVMRHGRIVEEGPVARLAGGHAHAYTQTLFKAMPELAGDVAAPRNAGRGEPVLQVYNIVFGAKQEPNSRPGLTFELRRGASLALVGEEGSGRRALASAVLGMERVQTGRVVFDAVDIGILTQTMLTRLRRRIAFITGDDDALDPRMTLWDAVGEPLRAHLGLPNNLIASYRESALKRVGLASLPGNRTVETLSAFDKRRAQVARAIVTAPLLAVIDEPLRGLDAFAQSVMRDLLRNFRDQEGPALIVITADFAVAQALAEDAFVFKDGQVIERGAVRELLKSAKEPYTRTLIEAVRAGPAAGLSQTVPEG